MQSLLQAIHRQTSNASVSGTIFTLQVPFWGAVHQHREHGQESGNWWMSNPKQSKSQSSGAASPTVAYTNTRRVCCPIGKSCLPSPTPHIFQMVSPKVNHASRFAAKNTNVCGHNPFTAVPRNVWTRTGQFIQCHLCLELPPMWCCSSDHRDQYLLFCKG